MQPKTTEFWLRNVSMLMHTQVPSKFNGFGLYRLVCDTDNSVGKVHVCKSLMQTWNNKEL
jgi:hypothetical protein